MTQVRRVFFDLDDKDVDNAEAMAIMRWTGFGKAADWDDVLRSRLVILLSEAQSGKTYECQDRQQKLWVAGEPAFYVELASVAAQPWRELRSPEQEERLQRWRRTETETATIFLDSLDELKLTQGRFQVALRNVANDLHGHMGRVRIVLTSRPLPVDRDLFVKTFAAPQSLVAPTEADFAKLAMGKDKTDGTEAPRELRYVSLLPLSQGDIARLAADRGVEDTDDFLDGLRKASMLEFMRRPQDVIEAASAWRELGGRFGTHAQQVAFDIRARLRPNPDRHDRPLEDARALEGAKRLALAVVLTHRLTIRHDVNNDPGDASTVLDPAVILSDWRDDDRKALLERALFGFSTYGRVRFHNRLAFEFLAAEHLSDLVDAGMSRKAARRLLVIQTAQGLDVVRPSLRDIAAWLALRQPWVFKLVNELDPALLMNLGDPGSLSVEQRQQLLATYIDRFGTGGWRGLSVPQIQIHRVAHMSLEPIIRGSFQTVENSEVRQTLLNLVAHSRFEGCADLARGVVWAKVVDHYERIDALDALIALDDADLQKVVEDLRDGPEPWDQRFARWIIYRLFPRHMTVAALVSVLSWLGETKSTGSTLSRNLPPLIADVPVDQLEDLRQGLMPLVEAGLRFDPNLHAAKNDRPHLVHLLSAVCARLLATGASSPEVTRSIALVAALARGVRSDEEVPPTLAEAVEESLSPARSAIFLEDVLLLRKLHVARDRLDLFMELVWRGTLHFRPDDDGWLREIVADPTMSPDARAAALLLHVFTIAESGNEARANLEELRASVTDDQDLVDFLENRLKPRVKSRQERRYEVCSRRRKQQQERREAKGEASWVIFWRELKSDPGRAFDAAHVKSTSWSLWNVMKRGGGQRQTCGWDRQLLEKHLGKEVADRLRAALMPVWRREAPPLSSELPREERNTLYERWILGLGAIAAEAEDPQWVQHLSPDEVETVLRYVSVVASNFPVWLDGLAAAHPIEVDRILGGEVSWLLSLPAPEQGYLVALQSVLYSAPEVAHLFLPRLRSWLATTGGLPQAGDEIEGFPPRLDQIIAILLKFGDETDRATIADMSSAAL